MRNDALPGRKGLPEGAPVIELGVPRHGKGRQARARRSFSAGYKFCRRKIDQVGQSLVGTTIRWPWGL
jgi:hypothetical protein